MAALIYDPGGPAERLYPLQPGLNSVGRARENDVVVNHGNVSRHHAEIAIVANRVYFKDLGSSNRSYVNGAPVELAELGDGDELRLGSTPLIYHAEVAGLDPNHGDAAVGKAPHRREALRRMLAQMADDDRDAADGSVIRVPRLSAGERALAKLEILLQISKRLSAPTEIDRLMERALELLFEYMAVDRAAILLLESGGLVARAQRARPGITADEGFYSKRIANAALEKGIPVLTADAGLDTRFKASESIVTQSIHASVCVPLLAGDGASGVLYVDNLSLRNVYSDEDAEFLTAIASQIALALDNARLSQQMQREAVYRSKLERFFPEAVGRRLRESDTFAIVNTEITALFCDIAGFTRLCSTMTPERIIGLLNRYFRVMVEDIVFPHQGTLEKYIGDALLAIWGAPYRSPDDAERAVGAAVAMQRAVADFNADWTAAGNAPIAIHIGLNTGPAAAGNIGSERMLQYAAIGDTTNIASRICGVAAAGEILISERTAQALPDGRFPLEPLAPVHVKGKDEPLRLYRLPWQLV
jgi:adenylate cyclase